MKKRSTEDTKALAKSRQVEMDYAALVAAIEQTHSDLSGRCKPSTSRRPCATGSSAITSSSKSSAAATAPGMGSGCRKDKWM